MILFAAGLFALVLWYLCRLVREVEMVEVGAWSGGNGTKSRGRRFRSSKPCLKRTK